MRECFYCSHERSDREIQMDHFPVPERHGGTETVPACTLCHSMKDRIPLTYWPHDVQKIAMEPIIDALLLAFSEEQLSEFVRTSALTEEMEEQVWKYFRILPPMARVLFAKLIHVQMDMTGRQA